MGTQDDRQAPQSLLDGEFDEAANQREFQNAVNAWRQGDNSEANTQVEVETEVAKPKPQPMKKRQDVEMGVNTETKLGVKDSCWQCYKLYLKDEMVKVDDPEVNKLFCSIECRDVFIRGNYVECSLEKCSN